MKKFDSKNSNLIRGVNISQRFDDDLHKVFGLTGQTEMVEAFVTSDGVQYIPREYAGMMPHIDKALKKYWDNSCFITGAGLTGANMNGFKEGVYFLLAIISARSCKDFMFLEMVAGAQDSLERMTQDDLSAVIMLALPLPVVKAGKDTAGFQIRNTHTMRILESMGLSDPLLSPYPILRPLFEVRCNPFTGYGYGGRQANEVTWRQAAFAQGIYGGKGNALAVNQYQPWSASAPLFYQFTKGVIEQFQANDFDL